ncbi:MAG: S8 family serine peptidase [Bacteroidetes bacterium]|nr:S8 family serine peptidase [Bacteroidota bacterium]
MKRMYSLLLVSVLLFAACSEEPNAPVSDGDASGPNVNTMPKTDGIPDIKDRYIVVFKDEVGNPEAVANELTRGKNAKIHFTYRHAIKGFAATIPEQALEGIRHNPNVDYIEEDGIVYKNTIQYNPPSWGLNRIDQRDLPLDNEYEYQNLEGEGVRVYIIDTGIKFDHTEYNGRAFTGPDYIDNDDYAYDCDGHGTHVAGTVGGTTVGVAKKVTLIAVRVLDCSGSGTYSTVIAGIDWVAGYHQKPAVANMSLGGGFSTSVNSAVNNAVAKGVVFAVAAGNNNRNACNYSPASAADALTVGATTSSDARASYSNYGSCVDIYAPGSSIYSSTMTGTPPYASWSGTSMATPHVAGVAALYLAVNTSAAPATVESAIKNGGTTGKLSNLRNGDPNLLLYSLIAGSSTPTVPLAPTLSVGSTTTSSITLNWTNVSSETGYRLELYDVSTSSWGTLATPGADVTTYTHSNLTPSTNYPYRIFAVNSVGDSPASNTVTGTTQAPVTIPNAPTNLAAPTITATAVSLTWSDNSNNEDNFYLKRSTDNGQTWPTMWTLADNSTQYTDNTVSGSTSYQYQVFAFNSAGSAGSNILSVNTPQASSNITIASITTNSIGNRNLWMAEFTVTIVDGNNSPVSGATVSGEFSGGYTGTESNTTDQNGQWTFPSGWVPKNVGSITFTVTSVSKSGETWDHVQKSAEAFKP